MSRRALAWAVLAAAVLPNAAAASPAADGPPAAAEAAADAEASAAGWLHRLEAAARGRGGLDARLRYTTVQGLLGDAQVRFGRLRQASDPAGGVAVDRFRIDLDGEAVDGTLRELDRSLIWDGQRLLDVDRGLRRVRLREVGGGEDLTRTLPIPLRVDAAELQRLYRVELVDDADAPAESLPPALPGADPAADPPVHLRLFPREAREDGRPADPLDVWFDPATGLPLRGATGRDGGDTQAVDLLRPAAVDGFEPGLFDTTPPAGPGWSVADDR
ncbi:hypothetical protein PSMK_15090 [Phycisphaera mikurensis NBRC 102666]|uniref:Uncharacterized protein n=1 Tax=Phycisphaera mikurensis (strain NBRC 102666 / KCTC 22515 / FYK2301M01) TaxID=1142394 RepID=I0IEI0_PHYMF|nr:hypothetical protein PSMK_15090 [Phycisphaera mikurensis NBRC 102666]